MEVENLYRMANSMTSTLDTPDREDIIQDAVIYCWQTLQRRACNVSYIYNRMRTQIINAVEQYGRQARFIPTEGMEEQVFREDPAVLSLPLQRNGDIGLTKAQRKTLETLVENNFEWDLTAKKLGISKATVSLQWRRAKPVLRKIYERAN